MSKEIWDYDSGESEGYNYLAALEITLINFKIITHEQTCEHDECRRFAKKWTYAEMRKLSQVVLNLKATVNTLVEMIDEQNAVIYDLRLELDKQVDSINDDIREVRNELSQDINQLEGAIDAVSDSVESSLDDFGSEIADLRHDLDKNVNEVDDITKNLADRVLLD